MKRIVYLLIALLASFGCICNTGKTVKQSESVSESTGIKGKYAVVVGVYRQEESAKQKVQKCEINGYEAAIVPQKDGLFAVVVCPTDNEEEALISLEKAKRDGVCPNDGWILSLDIVQ